MSLIIVVELTGWIVKQSNKVVQILSPNWVVNVLTQLEMDFRLILTRKGYQGKLGVIFGGIESVRDIQHLRQTLKSSKFPGRYSNYFQFFNIIGHPPRGSVPFYS